MFIALPGNGALYRFDTLGSVERVKALCAGRGEKLMQPLVDEGVTGDRKVLGEEDAMWTEMDTSEDGESIRHSIYHIF